MVIDPASVKIIRIPDGLLILMALAGCNPTGTLAAPPEETPATAMSTNRIEQVIAHYADSIMTLPDVVGIAEGLCNSQPCIRVLLATENTDSLARLPAQLEGIPVVAEVSGTFVASPQK